MASHFACFLDKFPLIEAYVPGSDSARLQVQEA